MNKKNFILFFLYMISFASQVFSKGRKYKGKSSNDGSNRNKKIEEKNNPIPKQNDKVEEIEEIKITQEGLIKLNKELKFDENSNFVRDKNVKQNTTVPEFNLKYEDIENLNMDHLKNIEKDKLKENINKNEIGYENFDESDFKKYANHIYSENEDSINSTNQINTFYETEKIVNAVIHGNNSSDISKKLDTYQIEFEQNKTSEQDIIIDRNSYFKEENVFDNINISDNKEHYEQSLKNQEILKIKDEKEIIFNQFEEKINPEMSIQDILQDNSTTLIPNKSINEEILNDQLETYIKNSHNHSQYDKNNIHDLINTEDATIIKSHKNNIIIDENLVYQEPNTGDIEIDLKEEESNENLTIDEKENDNKSFIENSYEDEKKNNIQSFNQESYEKHNIDEKENDNQSFIENSYEKHNIDEKENDNQSFIENSYEYNTSLKEGIENTKNYDSHSDNILKNQKESTVKENQKINIIKEKINIIDTTNEYLVFDKNLDFKSYVFETSNIDINSDDAITIYPKNESTEQINFIEKKFKSSIESLTKSKEIITSLANEISPKISAALNEIIHSHNDMTKIKMSKLEKLKSSLIETENKMNGFKLVQDSNYKKMVSNLDNLVNDQIELMKIVIPEY